MKRIIYGTIIVLALLGFSAFAQIPAVDKVLLSGIVVDESEQPMEFANVILLQLPDSTYYDGTLTNSSGGFRLSSPVAIDNYLLKVSYLGYKEQIIPAMEVLTPTKIQLLPDEQLLDEVLITARASTFSTNKGTIKVNVANTLLSSEHSVTDLIAKLPGMVLARGKLEFFGKGSPTIYLNGKKVRDQMEIAQLDVKNIKSVEIIPNPGAKYDSDTKVVINITTLKRENGFYARLGAGSTFSALTSYNGNITLGYSNDKFSVSAFYSYYDYSNKSFQKQEKTLNRGIKYIHTIDRNSQTSQNIHGYRLSMDYEIFRNHIIGVQLNGDYRDNTFDDEATNDLSIISSISNTAKSSFNTLGNMKDSSHTPQVNVFHNAQWSDKLNSAFNLDYLNYKYDSQQLVQEIAQGSTNQINNHTKSSYNLLSSEFLLTYRPFSMWTFDFGTGVSSIWGSGSTFSDVNPLLHSDYNNKETNVMSYVEGNYSNEAFSVKGGLRMEYSKVSYDNTRTEAQNSSQVNFFPSLTLSYDGDLRHTLSLSSRIKRPSLTLLDGHVYYSNKYLYESGNTNLKPQTTYSLEYMLGWNNLNLSARYTYINNYITRTYHSLPNQEGAILSTFENFPSKQLILLGANYRCKVKNWQPTFSSGVTFPFFHSMYEGKKQSYNTPTWYVYFRNNFELPYKFTGTFDLYYNGGGGVDIFVFKPYYSLSASLERSFFDKKLSIRLSGYDLLQTMNYFETGTINNIHFDQNEYYNSWNFKLSLIYRFSSQKKAYSGKPTTSNQIGRL